MRNRQKNIAQVIAVAVFMWLAFMACSKLNAQTVIVHDESDLRVLFLNKVAFTEVKADTIITITSPIILDGVYERDYNSVIVSGIVFKCDTTAFIRSPQSQDVADTWVATNITFNNCSFIANKFVNAPALILCAMIGGGAEKCFFKNFNNGVMAKFNLNGLYSQNRFTACNNSIFLTYGDWVGGGRFYSCNNTLVIQNRTYSREGGTYDYINLEGSTCIASQNISEGKKTLGAYYFEAVGNHVKDYQIITPYIEKPVDSCYFYINQKTDCKVTISNAWIQTTSTLLQEFGSGKIELRDIPYIPKLPIKNNGGKFIFTNVNRLATDFFTRKPVYLFEENTNTTWIHNYNASHYKLNGLNPATK